jgi:hypothetical protein
MFNSQNVQISNSEVNNVGGDQHITKNFNIVVCVDGCRCMAVVGNVSRRLLNHTRRYAYTPHNIEAECVVAETIQSHDIEAGPQASEAIAAFSHSLAGSRKSRIIL